MASLTTISTVEVDNPSRDMTATSKIFGGVDLRAHLPNPKEEEEEEEEDMMDNSKRNKIFKYLRVFDSQSSRSACNKDS
ncbi:unnamed protein product [Musa hybrid cultivar]